MPEGYAIPCTFDIGLQFADILNPKDTTRDYANETLQVLREYKTTLENISEIAVQTGTAILNDMIFFPLVAPSIVLGTFSHNIASVAVNADRITFPTKLSLTSYSTSNTYTPNVGSVNVAEPDSSNIDLFDFTFVVPELSIQPPTIVSFNFDTALPVVPELSNLSFTISSPTFIDVSSVQFNVPNIHDINDITVNVDLEERFITSVPDLESVTIYNHGLTAIVGALQSFVMGDLVTSVYVPIDLKSKYTSYVENRYKVLQDLWASRPVAQVYNKTIVVQDTFVTKYVDLFDDKVIADLVLQIKYKVKEMLFDGLLSIVRFIGDNILEFVRLVYQREVMLVEGRARLFEQYKSILSLYVAQARLELFKYVSILSKASVQRYQFLADIEVESAFAKYNKQIAALYVANEKLKLTKVNEAKLYALQADALMSFYNAQVQQQSAQLAVYKALVDKYKAKTNEYIAKLSRHALYVKQNVTQNELVSMANQITSVQTEMHAIPALKDSLLTKSVINNMLRQAEQIKHTIDASTTQFTLTDVQNYEKVAEYTLELLSKQKDYMVQMLIYNVNRQHFSLYDVFNTSLVQLANVVSDAYMQASNAYVNAQQQYYDVYQKYATGSSDVYATILSGKLSKYRVGATLNARGDISYSLDKAHGTRDTIQYSNNRSNECIFQFESA